MTIELKALLVKLTAGETPHLELKKARADGSLARLIPELDVLYGIPQTTRYHPEICTGIHQELALEVAARISDKPRVRFAALVHDLGKGLTPESEWPSHIAHEENGVPVVEQFCLRAETPDDWRILGMLTSKWHLHTHKAFELHQRSIVKLLVESGFIRELDMFEDFLLACEADKRGRLGMLESDYPQRKLLQAAMAAVLPVTTERVLPTPEGALSEARGFAVKAVLNQFKLPI